MKQAAGAAGPIHVLRLQPGEDVRITLRQWVTGQGIQAASITSAAGSLTCAHIRYANRADGMMTTADLEVVSLSGTLSMHGMHLHISVADRDGRMLGGHLLDGCLVRTTLELTVQEVDGVMMPRVKDEGTGYEELDPAAR